LKRLMLVLIVVLASACDSSGPTEETGLTGPTTGPTGPTSPPPPPPVAVPDVSGETMDAAGDMLQESALPISIEKKYSHEPKGVVLRQTPRAGNEVDPGTIVELIVAQAFPRIPNVTSKNLVQAGESSEMPISR